MGEPARLAATGAREHLDYAGADKGTGWETASGHETLARLLSVAAVRRAAVGSGR